jgi:ElaB/YqjD/DUF883 family membrane-anchored ribosome-binding protein
MAEQPPEVIQQQMAETRSRLAEKLDQLTQQATGTVETVAETVTDTAETVSDTVHTVTETVQETVETVREVFNIPGQVEKHPWAMFGGAVALGYFFGWLTAPRPRFQQAAVPAAPPAPPSPAQSGVNRLQDYWKEEHSSAQESRKPEGQPSNFWDSLTRTFGPTLDQLKGLAVGATLGLARDVVAGSIGNNLSSRVQEVFDDLTNRMGGTRVPPARQDPQTVAPEAQPANRGDA